MRDYLIVHVGVCTNFSGTYADAKMRLTKNAMQSRLGSIETLHQNIHILKCDDERHMYICIYMIMHVYIYDVGIYLEKVMKNKPF
jgi:hypothetical protein